MKALEASNKLYTLVQDIKSSYEEICGELAYYDAEYNDLTHALELTNFDKEKGYQLALQLQQNRKARREVKKESERLRPLYDLLTGQRELLGDLARATAKVHSVAQKQARRAYTPRVCEEIFKEREYEH